MSNKEQRFSVLFGGTGGQGVLKASEVAGVAAMLAGYHVRKSEVHGMAQRGGSVESHLIFGEVVFSPLIVPGEADFMVCFHANEGKRLHHFLKPDGVDFRPFLLDAEKLTDKRFVNTFLLGVLSAMLPIATEHWLNALEQVVAKRMDENRRVFSAGMERGQRK
jgi:indolepyruvate ferredoxin oxidoreductase beta subunit